MSGPRITLILDEDVPFVKVLRAIARSGSSFTNVDGFTFRIHRPLDDGKVVDLCARRQLNSETDAQIRAGMQTIFAKPTTPGAT